MDLRNSSGWTTNCSSFSSLVADFFFSFFMVLFLWLASRYTSWMFSGIPNWTTFSSIFSFLLASSSSLFLWHSMNLLCCCSNPCTLFFVKCSAYPNRHKSSSLLRILLVVWFSSSSMMLGYNSPTLTISLKSFMLYEFSFFQLLSSQPSSFRSSVWLEHCSTCSSASARLIFEDFELMMSSRVSSQSLQISLSPSSSQSRIRSPIDLMPRLIIALMIFTGRMYSMLSSRILAACSLHLPSFFKIRNCDSLQKWLSYSPLISSRKPQGLQQKVCRHIWLLREQASTIV